jgi:hypothetical protein
MFQTKVLEKFKTHIWCPITFSFFENLVFEMMRENIVQPDRLQMATRLICFACWIPKATNTQSPYSTLIAFPQHLSVTLHLHCLSCYTPCWGPRDQKAVVHWATLLRISIFTHPCHSFFPFTPPPPPAVFSLIIFTVECKLGKSSLRSLLCHAVSLNIPDSALATAISCTFRGAFGNVEAN